MIEPLASYDVRDPTAAPPHVRARAAEFNQAHFGLVKEDTLTGLRIGVPQVHCSYSHVSRTSKLMILLFFRSTSRASSKVALSTPCAESSSNCNLGVQPSCPYRCPPRAMRSAPTMSFQVPRPAAISLGTMELSMVSSIVPFRRYIPNNSS